MSPNVDALLLHDCKGSVQQLLAFTRQATVSTALHELGTSITQNPLWSSLGRAVLVARSGSSPLLGAFGTFSASDRRRFAELAYQLEHALATCRYIDYAAAEDAVELLASKLVDRFPRSEIERFRFTAIPRGGLIVLAMLAYALRLSPDQIVGPGGADKNGTLVVVDDCALSGLRFRRFLRSERCSRVVFCPLFANADLCRAVEQREARVVDCITAEELPDRAPQIHGADYPAWHRHWTDAMQSDGYWVGQPDYLAFAWGEPQAKSWNPDREEVEAGWCLLPAGLALKRRWGCRTGAVGDEHAVRGFHLQPDSPGPFRAAPRVLWVELDSAIAVARMPDDTADAAPCLRLDGSAAEMWRTLLRSANITEAGRALVRQYDLEPRRLRRDLDSFVAELQGAGVLAVC